MAKLFSLVSLVLSFSLLAETGPRPTILDPAIHSDHTGGLTPREFFEERAKKTDCVAGLNTARAAFRKIQGEVNALLAARKPNTLTDGNEDAEFKKANDEIDKKTVPYDAARTEMLKKMAECGECATLPLEPRSVDVGANKTQNWYISTGFCQLPLPNKTPKERKVLVDIFKNLSESLATTSRYPRTNPGGFTNILGFKVANPKDLSVTADDKMPASPLKLFLWVLGPDTGITQLGFLYYLDAAFATKRLADVEKDWTTAVSAEPKTIDAASPPPTPADFELRFETTPDPRITLLTKTKVKGMPAVSNTTLSGRALSTTMMWLKNVQGQWYLTSDGYIRYYTAAEFPIKIPDIDERGRRVLLETLSEISARGGWETL